MARLLHIVTKSEDALAKEIISKQGENSENQIEVVDVSQGTPDYKELVQKIFNADSVQVW